MMRISGEHGINTNIYRAWRVKVFVAIEGGCFEQHGLILTHPSDISIPSILYFGELRHITVWTNMMNFAGQHCISDCEELQRTLWNWQNERVSANRH